MSFAQWQGLGAWSLQSSAVADFTVLLLPSSILPSGSLSVGFVVLRLQPQMTVKHHWLLPPGKATVMGS
jgi:hypothetical protein